MMYPSVFKISRLVFVTGWLWLVGLSVIFVCSFHFVSAQSLQSDSGLHIVTSPLPLNLVTEPGGTISTPIKVKNGGVQPETLKISLMKFKAYEQNGQPQLLDPEPGDDFLHWVHFSEDTFTLAPDEWKTINAVFSVPQSAAFGYYYAIVFSRADTAKEGALEHQTAVVGGSAVLALLEVRVPHAKRSVEVVEFTTDKKWYEFLPVNFVVTLKNTGNVHIAPRGNIFIDRGDEHDIAFLEINPERGNILPDSLRRFEETWNAGFPFYAQQQSDGKTVLDEQGHPVMELSWNWEDASKLRWGKYTAKMLLVYDDGQRDIPVEGETSFWVMPWRLIGIVLLIIAFVLIGLKSVFFQVWQKFRTIPAKTKR